MPARALLRDSLLQLRTLAKWALLVVPSALVTGSAVALFLWSLDLVTRARWDNPWLLYGLPFAGLGMGLVYHYFGKSSDGGNNLILDQIYAPGGGVPRRMAPLILLSTLVTHLFGGSAGREGTAVQMGGSIAATFAKPLKLSDADVRVLLMTGVAAGFGAVFGTPLAGAIFALEVLVVGRIDYRAILPCFLASIVGDWTCHAWGVSHAVYRISFLADLAPEGVRAHTDLLLLGKVALAAVAFGLISQLSAELTHGVQRLSRALCPYTPARPVIGGVAVIALTLALGTTDYLGLSVTAPTTEGISLAGFFTSQDVHPWAWWWKLLFTAVTLGFGFKGGEVTPLFFIGAAAGNVAGWLLGAPVDLFAALGFVAVFAAASNTPIACTVMGLELFGNTHGVYLATACLIAYFCGGHSGIYQAQRVGIPKRGSALVPENASLRDTQALHPPFLTRVIRTLLKTFHRE